MKYFIAILFLTNSIHSYGQTKKAAILTEPMKLEFTNGREIFNLCKVNPTITYKDDLEYFWYNEFSGVKSTKGGSGGKLLHGKYQFFDEKGNLIVEANYSAGLKDGNETLWKKDGNILESHKYKNGVLIYAKLKTEDGEHILEWNGPPMEVGSVKKIYTPYGLLEQSEELLADFNFKVTVFYESGKVNKSYKTGSFMDGVKSEYVEYYESGITKIRGMLEGIWRVDDWYWYNEDGTVDTVEKYRIRRQYYLDKNLSSEGGEFYDSNKKEWIRTGLWIWYLENGKDIKETKEYEFGVEITGKK